ncbi:MAG: hypothetical protein FWH27_15090 [Planctomycetaceae bacterium]|nr:hypothetical protein [Planctomycetaceae bacterium]
MTRLTSKNPSVSGTEPVRAMNTKRKSCEINCPLAPMVAIKTSTNDQVAAFSSCSRISGATFPCRSGGLSEVW